MFADKTIFYRLRYLILFGLALLISATLYSQSELSGFPEKFRTINNGGMYILAGWAVSNMAYGTYGWATADGQRSDLLKGYGNSLILQGGFLLVFDLILYQVIKNNRLDYVDNIGLIFTGDMTGFQLSLKF